MEEPGKKFYWLQLKNDFFKRHEIQIVEAMPNGKDYILFYLKLLCESVAYEGNLRFNESIPYNENMLSVITNTNVDIVRSAVKIFNELDMMEIMDDGTFYMREVNKMIGSAANNDNANRQRRYRERKKQEALLDCNTSVTKNNASVTPSVTGSLQKITIVKVKDKDKDKDRDRDRDRDLICADAQIQPTTKPKKQKPEKHKYGSFSNVLLTDDEYSKLKEQFSDADERIENLSFGIASKGYQYKNHYATILAWARNDNKRAIQQQKKQSSFIDYAEIGRQMDLERMKLNEVVTV